ncbi:MAG: hypothetical protein J7J42_05460 [Thermoplasmata archaeon]|nr:hypothetical protein [Thermoplasmata archaeon]
MAARRVGLSIILISIYSLIFGIVSMFLFGACLSCHGAKICGVPAYPYAWGLCYGAVGTYILSCLFCKDELNIGNALRTGMLAYLFLTLLFVILADIFYQYVYLDVLKSSPLTTGLAYAFITFSLLPAIFLFLHLRNVGDRDVGVLWSKHLSHSLIPAASALLLGSAFYLSLPDSTVHCPWPGVGYLSLQISFFLLLLYRWGRGRRAEHRQ